MIQWRDLDCGRVQREVAGGSPFLDDIIALHVMDVSPKYSSPILVRAKFLLEVRDASCSSWIGVSGPPRSIRTDEGGEWRDELWSELRSERRIKLLFQGVGARPWILESRRELARGIYNRLQGDDRSLGKQILAEVQWRLNALISGSGFPAYQMVFGSNPVDLCGRGGAGMRI